MSEFSTRVTVDSMEDAWMTPLPSHSPLSSKRGRSGSPSSVLALRGVRSGPHTTFPRLMCLT
eukprot:951527-Prymnesium_polylepis.1